MVKLVIRFGILIVVLVAIFLAYNLFVARPMADKIADAQRSKSFTEAIGGGLQAMLAFKDEWRGILASQRRDIEFVRTVLPEAPFNEKNYLLILLDIFNQSHVASKGVSIRPVKPAASHLDFYAFITADLGVLATSIGNFGKAFDYLEETDPFGNQQIKRFDKLTVKPDASPEELEIALWYSYQFNKRMAIDIPPDKSLAPGFEIHRFDTTVTGSYENIKRFIWMIQNMRPHTVIVNWHLVPGAGLGEDRIYTASMSLVTFVDTNIPPKYDVDPNNPDMPDITLLRKKLGL